MEGKGSRNGFEESEGMSMQGEYSGVGDEYGRGTDVGGVSGGWGKWENERVGSSSLNFPIQVLAWVTIPCLGFRAGKNLRFLKKVFRF